MSFVPVTDDRRVADRAASTRIPCPGRLPRNSSYRSLETFHQHSLNPAKLGNDRRVGHERIPIRFCDFAKPTLILLLGGRRQRSYRHVRRHHCRLQGRFGRHSTTGGSLSSRQGTHGGGDGELRQDCAVRRLSWGARANLPGWDSVPVGAEETVGSRWSA